ncbi:MAG: efflux RND transporter periplasmic adaptor subunit [Betaproteobacteria bacterium]|nr:efflux RND transporter periplasmic adaptor subunit [Betaproteobacteria bacterium]
MNAKQLSAMSLRASLLTSLLAALLIAGCGDRTTAPALANTHAEAGEKITHFSEKTELFVEFPTLVVGQAATFVAHFTQLADFKPLAEGKLTVLLAGGNAPDERFTADAPAVPGIFKPAVTPGVAGERELTLIVESALGTLTHELGPVAVFATAADASHGEGTHEHEHEEAGIPFSKEQQWKIDFATTEAVKGVARPSLAATATIKAHPDSEARLAAPAAGLLRAAGSFPRVGQTVHKGQVLAWLAPRLGGDTDQATLEAAAGKARIALAQAMRERQRMETLFADEAVPEKRLLAARADEGLAQAEAKAAQARAGQLSGSGGSGIAIRAPVAGVIADVAVAAGAFVAEGAPLFHIADTARLWLEARVPESELGKLGKPGTPTGAAFSVDGYAQPFVIDTVKLGKRGDSGKLIGVGNAVDAVTRTVPVIFEFANPDGALRLGMTARAQIFAGDGEPAVLVPASAVQNESGTQVVYVQSGGESFARHIVQTGARDGERIAIVAGLEAGQRVVSKGGYLIRLSTSKAGPAGHAH